MQQDRSYVMIVCDGSVSMLVCELLVCDRAGAGVPNKTNNILYNTLKKCYVRFFRAEVGSAPRRGADINSASETP